MRITHVLTYVSEDGSFGGPTAVALAQLDDLKEKDVICGLVAGWDGHVSLNSTVSHVFGRVWKLGKGFKFIFAPRVLWEMIGPRPQREILHIHLGRDFVSMSAAIIAMLRKLPFVVQTHGMITLRSSISIRLFDSLFTIPVLRHAERVYVLTDEEELRIASIAKRGAAIESLANGIKDVLDSPEDIRDPHLIVFLARLHPRKRVLAFVEMCRLLRDQGVRFRAEVYGPDEGDLDEMLHLVRTHDLDLLVKYCGSVNPGQSIGLLRKAGVFVLPSYGEVFPMTVLESMVSRTAVVTTMDSGLSEILSALDAAEVTDGSPEELANATARVLVDSSRRVELVRNAQGALESHFGIRAVTNQLVNGYREILDRRNPELK